jgi:hypothetical protein
MFCIRSLYVSDIIHYNLMLLTNVFAILSNKNSSQGACPTRICRAKYGASKSGSDLNEKLPSNRWDQASPHVDDSEPVSLLQWPLVPQGSTMGANAIAKSKTGSLSPWSRTPLDSDCIGDTVASGRDLGLTSPDRFQQSRYIFLFVIGAL